ncbi:MAG: CocE/NonD family hydrolase [Mycobacterium sp.]
MGAGTSVGRVGGLAVALGIGAAVLVGAATAEADDGAAAGASSNGPPSSSASTPTRETAPSKRESASTADHPDADSRVSGDGSAKRDDDETAPRTSSKRTKKTEQAAPLEPEQSAAEPELPAEDAPDDQPGGAADEPTKVEEAQAADEPASVAATELAATTKRHQATALDEPAGPSLTPVVMSLVGGAREAAQAPDPGTAAQPTTSVADTTYPIPTDVTVTEVIAPLQWLQTIPVVGELVVTPVVRLIHAIPFVGEFLHPVIGWPIDHDAPPGAPRPRTVRVTSFDGTSIFAHFMPASGLEAGQDAPTVLSGPGLGLPGATTLDLQRDGLLPNDVIGVGALRDAGYNVVTWDPRGEWRSGGVMHLNSPALEGRDVSAIITWVASQSEVQLDDTNDPRIGMVGASYGGGIQLATAAIDHRIDALVPTIAWDNLVDVLFPRGAVNSGWGTILPSVLVLTLAREHPRILPVAVMGVLFGIAQQSDIDLVNGLGYQDQIQNITAPTLLIQGTVDTLFTLDQAHTVAGKLIDAGTTTKVIWYCGGHGACLSDDPKGEVVLDSTLDWLDRYVKGNTSTDVGPQFEWVDQNGDWHNLESYPLQQDTTPTVVGSAPGKTVPFIPLIGGSGPDPLIFTQGLVEALLGLPSAAAATNAVDLDVPAAKSVRHIVGAPELTLTYSGTGSAKHVYAQIVDDETGLVLGNQATPIPVVLDGESHTVTYSLERVAHTLKPGQSATVQIVTSSAKFLNFYSWGSVTVEGMSIKLPTLEGGAQAQPPIVAA